MCRWLHRPALRAMCGWLLVVCTAGIAAASPALTIDPIGGRAVGFRALDDLETLLPPVAINARSAAYDDLSGPAAAGVFRLASPVFAPVASPEPAPIPLGSPRDDAAAERGPPPLGL